MATGPTSGLPLGLDGLIVFFLWGLLELSRQSPGHLSACCTYDKTFRALRISQLHIQWAIEAFRRFVSAIPGKQQPQQAPGRGIFLTRSLNVENDKRERPLQTDSKAKAS